MNSQVKSVIGLMVRWRTFFSCAAPTRTLTVPTLALREINEKRQLATSQASLKINTSNRVISPMALHCTTDW